MSLLPDGVRAEGIVRAEEEVRSGWVCCFCGPVRPSSSTYRQAEKSISGPISSLGSGEPEHFLFFFFSGKSWSNGNFFEAITS